MPKGHDGFFATLPRRSFVRRGSILAGSALLAPVIEPWIRAIGTRSLNLDSNGISEVELAAFRKLLQNRQQGYFEAQANPLMFLFALIGAIAAVLEILTYFGIRPSFSREVQYIVVTGEGDFRRAEFEARQSGFQSFNGVARSPVVDRNFSTLVAKDDAAGKAQMTSVYEGNNAVSLIGWEPSVIHSAMKFVADKYGLSQSELAQTMAITGKTNRVASGNVQLSSYRTAGGGFILHDRTPTPECKLGKIAIHVPEVTDPKELPMLWLQA